MNLIRVMPAEGRTIQRTHPALRFLIGMISNQPWTPNRSGVIALLELTKDRDGKAALTATGFVPTWVARDGWRHRVTELRGGGRETAGPLAATLRRLPAANRVSGSAIRDLPHGCTTPAETAVSRR